MSGEAQASSGVDCAVAFSGGQNREGFRDHLVSPGFHQPASGDSSLGGTPGMRSF